MTHDPCMTHGTRIYFTQGTGKFSLRKEKESGLRQDIHRCNALYLSKRCRLHWMLNAGCWVLGTGWTLHARNISQRSVINGSNDCLNHCPLNSFHIAFALHASNNNAAEYATILHHNRINTNGQCRQQVAFKFSMETVSG